MNSRLTGSDLPHGMDLEVLTVWGKVPEFGAHPGKDL